jgi:hypothetical protein
MLEQASKGIGTGIGLAFMGVGAGIALDALRNIQPSSKTNRKKYPVGYKPATFKPIRWRY